MGLLGAVRAWADAEVYVRSTGFSPSSVSINPGEVVYFIVGDDNGPYCVQSTTGAWTPWYLWDYGEYFGIQFNERGDYYYRDAFDYSHTGVVHVGTGVTNVPPSVSITSPTDGAVFTEPASFTFGASASDADNGILAIEFYVDSNLMDTSYTAPFSTVISNLAAGFYTLTAVAYDTAAGRGTASVNVTVQPAGAATITLSAPNVLDGEFHFQANGMVVGKQAVLQSASSPEPSADWVSLQTNSVTESAVSFGAPIMPGSRFFRVLQLP